MQEPDPRRRPRRILFIDHDDGWSGSSVSLEYLLGAFGRREYEVFVLTPKKGHDLERLARSAGSTPVLWHKGRWRKITLDSHFTNVRSLLSLKGPLLLVYEMLKFVYGGVLIWSTIRRLSPDLVYVNEHVVLEASVAAWLARKPSVLHIRSLMLSGAVGLRRRLFAWTILTFNRSIFAITALEAEQLRTGNDCSAKVRIIGEFFSPPEITRYDSNRYKVDLGLPGDANVVAMLGGIEAEKGSLIFLRSVPHILAKFPNTVFVIAGRHDRTEDFRMMYREECLRAIDKLDKPGVVYLLGEISNPIDVVSASDVLVSPSTRTHFSRPVVEAWGMSKPVVASRTEHMQKLIEDGIDGLLFNVGDPEDLARCIIRLLSDVPEQLRLGEEGRKKVERDFWAERNLQTIIDICETALTAR